MPWRRCDASTPACRSAEVVNGQQGQRNASKDGRWACDDSFGIQLCQLKDYDCVICCRYTKCTVRQSDPESASEMRAGQLGLLPAEITSAGPTMM